MKSYNLYIPGNKFYITPDKVIFSLMLLFLFPALIEFWVLQHNNDELSLFSKICLYIVPVIVIAAIVVSARNIHRHEPLKGTISGRIIFEKERIIVDNLPFLINEVEKISVRFSDYKSLRKTYRGFNGKLSNGIDNEIIIELPGGEIQVYFFQVEDRLGAEPIRDELINYHLSGKLHFLNLIELLNITDYNKIQQFKKEIGITLI